MACSGAIVSWILSVPRVVRFLADLHDPALVHVDGGLACGVEVHEELIARVGVDQAADLRGEAAEIGRAAGQPDPFAALGAVP